MAAETSEGKGGWCYLDGNGQHQGPFPIEYLQGLNKQGYFHQEVLFWREGQPEWKPLKDLPELAQQLQQEPPTAAPDAAAAGQVAAATAAAAEGEEEEGDISAQQQGQQQQQQLTKAAAVQSAASAAAELAGAAAGGGGGRKAGAVLAGAPVVVAAPAQRAAGGGGASGEDPELAGFLAEISALEGEAGVEGEGAAPESPSPEERSFVDDDGTLYVWDSSLRKFMPKEDEQGYTEEDMVFVADEEVIPAYNPPKPGGEEDEDEDMGQQEGSKSGGGPSKSAQASEGGEESEQQNGESSAKRTRQEEAMEKARERAKRARAAKEQQAGWFELKVNTSVYVTGLPEDVTEAELSEAFGKCGIIKEDDQRRPRIKIYRDKGTGRPKGDGLVTFLKEPSVDLAIQILDGAPLRYGLQPMSVSKAKFEQKGGEYVAKQDPRQKRAKKKVLQKLEKDLGWGGFDDVLKPQQVTVVIKHMFHPDEFLADLTYREELEGDIQAECAKLGPVDKVRVFQHNPEGVVSVKFKTEEAADACTAKMNGRYFSGRQLEAFKWDGVTNYNVKPKETEEEQRARLDKFAAEIEGQEAGPEIEVEQPPGEVEATAV